MWRFGCSMARTATIGGCIALSAHAYSAYRPSPCYALPANTRRNASAAAATAARANEPTDTVSQKEFQKMRKELAAAKKKLATYEKDKVEKPKRGMAETQYERSGLWPPSRTFQTTLAVTCTAPHHCFKTIMARLYACLTAAATRNA
jgi:hypothetical protein